MVHQIPKKGKKRQYNPGIKVHKERRIQPPEDQSFDGGFSITMDTYDFNALTGDRDRKTGRVSARFPTAEQLSDFYEQNRRIIIKEKPVKSVGEMIVDAIVAEANEMLSV